MDVPVEQFGMPTLPRATQRDVATLALRKAPRATHCNVVRPKHASQPIELQQVAT
jgi:hypothetical protein